MFSWILQISIVSIIFIFLVHHLLCFFKSTLTVPKMKDLVNSPVKKYQDIFDTITNTNTNGYGNKYLPDPTYSDTDYTDINLLPTENSNTNTNTNANASIKMKDELKMFLKKQLNGVSSELDQEPSSSSGSGSSFGSAF